MFAQRMYEMTQLAALKQRQMALFDEMTRDAVVDDATLERAAHRRFVRRYKFRSFVFRLAPRVASRLML